MLGSRYSSLSALQLYTYKLLLFFWKFFILKECFLSVTQLCDVFFRLHLGLICRVVIGGWGN